jgi:cbb3-type cytochrome oxidase maturation protein
MVRPIRAETVRYGENSKPGEFVYDRPFLWGSRRVGPDLHRVGGKYPHLWQVRGADAGELAHGDRQLVPGPYLRGACAGGRAVEVMFILLPLALLLASAALGVFIWAVTSGQFDDLSTPGLRILHEDDPPAAAPCPKGAGGGGQSV